MKEIAMSGGCLLEISNLSFRTEGVEILKSISFRAEKGELVGIIGPNGAGKTTLLKCLNGIYPSCGEILVNGRRTASMSQRQIASEIAHMYQNTVISSSLPSLDIVLMGRYPHLGRYSAEKPKDYQIARDSMKYTSTLEFEKQSVNRLSGGERQRVLFAKVLAQQTEIILLDEPTANLDITHQEQIFQYCSELCSSGTLVLAAVHDIKTAARYCSRLILMKAGEIIADGKPGEVLTPDNLLRAYGVNALVYRNRITGELDIHIFSGDRVKAGRRVHVIGGGGSASAIMRQLYEYGFDITAGVLSHGDSDIQTAEVFGIRYVACRPFSEITEEAFETNKKLVSEAEFTVLCNMPFGTQNMRNLEAAGTASRLIIIEDEQAGLRDFTGGAATKIYEGIKNRALITSSARFHEFL